MKTKTKSHSQWKNVGKKQEVPEKNLSRYTLYDKCCICPLSVYVDMVCNDNLKALIISGNPSDEVLRLAKVELLTEFAELSGSNHIQAYCSSLKNILVYRSHIECINLSIALLYNNTYDEPIEALKSIGIKVNKPKNEAEFIALMNRIDGIRKGKLINLNKDFKKFEALNKDSDTQKPTEWYYEDQLAALSLHYKFHIGMDITLARYASYLKHFQKSLENGKLEHK